MVQEDALKFKAWEKEVMAKKFNEVLAVKRLGIFFYLNLWVCKKVLEEIWGQ